MKLHTTVSRSTAVVAALLVALGACGEDDPPADAPGMSGEAAAARSGGTATTRRQAMVTVGDRSWTFSDFSCLILRGEESVHAMPQLSDDDSVKLEVSHEAGGRSAVIVKAVDDSFQYTMGEAGRAGPSVEIDGMSATFEGVFVNAYGSGEQTEGSVTLRC